MSDATASSSAYGTGSYRAYVLGLLLLAYSLNYLDRALISVLNEPIRLEFGLSDLQMGLLGGTAFALLFAVLGLPIARLAESFDRRVIIALSVAIWSVMTGLCGLAGQLDPVTHSAIFIGALSPLMYLFVRARMWGSLAIVLAAAVGGVALLPILNGYGLLAFGLLLVTRIGVGIGEAGCAPSANSLIADYYSPERRTTALSIFALGLPLGGVAAAVGGSLIAGSLDWRSAFLLLGLPGIAVAIVIFATVSEPPRATNQAAPAFSAVVRLLLSKRSFIHLVIGCGIASFIGSGTGHFSFALFSRAYGLSLSEAAVYFVLTSAFASAIGIFLGGFLSDRLSRRIPNAIMIVPGVALIAAAPLLELAFLSPAPLLLLLGLVPASILASMFIGPAAATMQGLVHPRMRATAVAIFAFIITIVGYLFGPPMIGLLSDVLSARSFASATGLDFAALCSNPASLHEACNGARGAGLQDAFLVSVAGYAWAGLHLLLAARTVRRDLVS